MVCLDYRVDLSFKQGTNDDRHWQSLSRSLERMSTMTDGAQTYLEVSNMSPL